MVEKNEHIHQTSTIYENPSAPTSQTKLLSSPTSPDAASGSNRPLMPIFDSTISSPKTILNNYGDGDDDLDDFDDAGPTAGFSSCSINLLKTILGAGMLAMPWAFAALGYVLGTTFVLLAGSLAAFGLHLFVASAQYASRNVTINKLASLTYPKMTFVFDLAIALKCFGVALSYLIVIGDMMPSIAQGLGLEHWVFISRGFWLIISMILLVPLAFLRRIDSLKYSSFAGLLGVFYLLGVALWNYYKPDAVHAPPGAGIEPFASISLASLKSFSVFVFSFTCHQNVLAMVLLDDHLNYNYSLDFTNSKGSS